MGGGGKGSTVASTTNETQSMDTSPMPKGIGTKITDPNDPNAPYKVTGMDLFMATATGNITPQNTAEQYGYAAAPVTQATVNGTPVNVTANAGSVSPRPRTIELKKKQEAKTVAVPTGTTSTTTIGTL